MRRLALLLCLSLAACGSPTPVMTASATVETRTPMPEPTLTPTITAPLPDTPTPSITPTEVMSICSPLQNHPFAELPGIIAWQYDPLNADPTKHHFGVDFGHWGLGSEISTLGDPVQAMLAGNVAGTVNDRPPYGFMIMIEVPRERIPLALLEQVSFAEGESLYYLYSHLQELPEQTRGQAVACGQRLNHIGMTGWTGAPHLHVEMRHGPAGFTFSEMAYYTADASALEMETYRAWFLSGNYQAFDPMILLATP